MGTGTSLARGQNRTNKARALCTIGASEGPTPTFATHAASHVYLLFNEIQELFRYIAALNRHVRAMYRHVYGTRTIGGGSVL